MSGVTANVLKIVKVDGKALTFAIPPGQRKYSRRMFESGASGDTEPEADVTMVDGDQLPPTVVDSMPGATQGVTGTETNCGEESRASENGVGASVVKETVENGNLPDIKAQKADIASENKTDEDDVAEGTNSEGTAVNVNTKPEQNGIHEATTPEGDNANGLAAQTDGGQSSKASTQEEDVFHSISVLTQLENKIVDVDGHFNSKDIPTQNAWRSFRGLRNNQDLGTLFEMREEFYVYKHPQIVKEAKRKR